MTETTETRNRTELWTPDMVEAAMVEAVRTAARMPDRERAWQAVKAWWPTFRNNPWDFPKDYDPQKGFCVGLPARMPPPSSRAITLMFTALDFAQHISAANRPLVQAVIRQKAAGRERISWVFVRQLYPGVSVRTLKRRYWRVMGDIAAALNA